MLCAFRFSVTYKKNKSKEIIVWHSGLKIDKFEDGKDAICSLLPDIESSEKRCALVITASPDKTFTIVFDEEGNQTLFDSHVHVKGPFNQTFEEAYDNPEGRGVFVLGKQTEVLLMIDYVLEILIPELRAEKTHGSVVYIESKNF